MCHLILYLENKDADLHTVHDAVEKVRKVGAYKDPLMKAINKR